ncbi:MAG TPA: prenyltransferase/squalene oxidase repeat-containing protein [Candidatus Acidoferrum sp.]
MMSSPERSTTFDPSRDQHGFTGACFSLLKQLQNSDGGWGFHSGGLSNVEATCWAARALSSSSDASDLEAVQKAFEYLQSAQHSDGSWPACGENPAGSWVTSLACSVLSGAPKASSNVRSGLSWLADDFPRDSSPLRRFVRKMMPGSPLSEQSDAFRGWGWTPRTSSWVEPTSFALMAFEDCAGDLLPPNSTKRRESAIALLYDRMCPGGGWNCGNPRVYGVDGEPLVLPTCWALLALCRQPERPERAKSLAWLHRAFANVKSASSYAVARVTFAAYGILPSPTEFDPTSCDPSELAAQSIHSLAWRCLESDAHRIWPTKESVQQPGEGQ